MCVGFRAKGSETIEGPTKSYTPADQRHRRRCIVMKKEQRRQTLKSKVGLTIADPASTSRCHFQIRPAAQHGRSSTTGGRGSSPSAGCDPFNALADPGSCWPGRRSPLPSPRACHITFDTATAAATATVTATASSRCIPACSTLSTQHSALSTPLILTRQPITITLPDASMLSFSLALRATVRPQLLSSTTPFLSCRRHLSATIVSMAPPKSAHEFLDFVNASPTRESWPQPWSMQRPVESLVANTTDALSAQPTMPLLRP